MAIAIVNGCNEELIKAEQLLKLSERKLGSKTGNSGWTNSLCLSSKVRDLKSYEKAKLDDHLGCIILCVCLYVRFKPGRSRGDLVCERNLLGLSEL